MIRAELMDGGPADGTWLTLPGPLAEVQVGHCRYPCPGLYRYTLAGPMDGRDGVRHVYYYAGEVPR